MKSIVAISLALALSGCAYQAQNDFMKWRDTTKAAAQRGEVKWSDYYIEGFNRLEPLVNQPGVRSSRRAFAELIPVAQKYEAGQITKEEFENAKRMASVARDDGANQEYAEAQRQQAVQNQNINNALLMMQAAQPKPIQQTTTSCSSYKLGNTVQTDCR